MSAVSIKAKGSPDFTVTRDSSGRYHLRSRDENSLLPLRETKGPVRIGEKSDRYLYVCQSLGNRVVTGIVHIVETPKKWRTKEIQIF